MPGIRSATRSSRSTRPLGRRCRTTWPRASGRIRDIVEGFNDPVVELDGYEADDVIGTLAVKASRGRTGGGDRLGRQGLLPARRPGHPPHEPRARRSDRRGRRVGHEENAEREVRDALHRRSPTTWPSSETRPTTCRARPASGPRRPSSSSSSIDSVEALIEHAADLGRSARRPVPGRERRRRAALEAAGDDHDGPRRRPGSGGADASRSRTPPCSAISSSSWSSGVSPRQYAAAAQAADGGALGSPTRSSVEEAGGRLRHRRRRRAASDEVVEEVRGAGAVAIAVGDFRAGSAAWRSSSASRSRWRAAGLVSAGRTSTAVRAHLRGRGPGRGPQSPRMVRPTDGMTPLRELLEDPTVEKVGHDLKHAILALSRAGSSCRDSPSTRWSRATSSIRAGGGTSSRRSRWRSSRTSRPSTLRRGRYGKAPISFAEAPVERASRLPVRAGGSRGSARRDFRRPARRGFELGDRSWPTSRCLSCPCSLRMELAGIAIDEEFFRRMRARLKRELDLIQEEIFKLAGGDFNLNSTPQLRQVPLREARAARHQEDEDGSLHRRHGAGGAGRDGARRAPAHDGVPGAREAPLDVRRRAAPARECPDGADPHQLQPDRRGDRDACPRAIPTFRTFRSGPRSDGRSGRASWRRTGTPSSRWTTPRSSCACWPTSRGDEAFVTAFTEGIDVHRQTASVIFDVPVDDVGRPPAGPGQDGELRDPVRAGPLLAGSPARHHREEARDFIDTYFERFQGVRDFLDAQVEMAKESGYVETLMGRRRYVPELKSGNWNMRQFGERVAQNTPIQGTAADLMKQAMIDVQAGLDGCRHRGAGAAPGARRAAARGAGRRDRRRARPGRRADGGCGGAARARSWPSRVSERTGTTARRSGVPSGAIRPPRGRGESSRTSPPVRGHSNTSTERIP